MVTVTGNHRFVSCKTVGLFWLCASKTIGYRDKNQWFCHGKPNVNDNVNGNVNGNVNEKEKDKRVIVSGASSSSPPHSIHYCQREASEGLWINGVVKKQWVKNRGGGPPPLAK